MDVNSRDKGVFIFGPFRLDPVRRLLLRNAAPIKLSARLFDTLLYLVQNHDRLVEHAELEHAVWRGRMVEEGNVAKAVYSLRKVLQADDASAGYIATVAGRGYRFAAPVAFESEPAGPEPSSPAAGEPIDWSPPAPVAVTNVSPANRPWWRSPASLGIAALGLALAASAAIRGLQPAPETTQQASPMPTVAPTAAAPFAPPPRSVAVMAFTNLSGDPNQEYFSDGLSEELINSLGQIGQLRVPARLSSFTFKGKSATVDEIARKLNVGAVLEGSVRRNGSRLRVTAQLIDGMNGFQLWSHSYDRDWSDNFRLQGEIAAEVANSLQVTLLGADADKLTVGGTRNPAAFDAYLRGVALRRTDMYSEAAQRKALEAFDRAVALDPNYAIAAAERANAIGSIAELTASSDLNYIKRLQDQSIAEARRAVALAPGLASAHATLGVLLLCLAVDFRGAEAEFRRAKELAPGDSLVLTRYGQMEVYVGHTQSGVEAGRLAAALDPLSPGAYSQLAWLLYYARQYDDALEAQRHAELLGAPASGYALVLTGYLEYFKGNAAAARLTCSDEQNWQEHECLALAYHALGMQAAADTQMAKLKALAGDARAYDYADIYAQWGDLAEAVHWLGKATDLRGDGLYYVKTDPALDPIRGTTGFKDIEHRLNFPP